MPDVNQVCPPLPDAEELERPNVWKLPGNESCPEPATSEHARSWTLLDRLNVVDWTRRAEASRERAPALQQPQRQHLPETAIVRIDYRCGLLLQTE